MVEEYKNKDFLSLTEFIKSNRDEDFYITSNNQRLLVNDDKSLKLFLKESKNIFITYERGDILGVIGLCKSIGNNISRYYIKLNAINEDIADRLLTVFLWNNNKELYVKIKKNSKFYKVFRNKQFNFKGDRGSQVLLIYSKIYNRKKEHVHQYNNNKN